MLGSKVSPDEDETPFSPRSPSSPEPGAPGGGLSPMLFFESNYVTCARAPSSSSSASAPSSLSTGSSPSASSALLSSMDLGAAAAAGSLNGARDGGEAHRTADLHMDLEDTQATLARARLATVEGEIVSASAQYDMLTATLVSVARSSEASQTTKDKMVVLGAQVEALAAHCALLREYIGGLEQQAQRRLGSSTSEAAPLSDETLERFSFKNHFVVHNMRLLWNAVSRYAEGVCARAHHPHTTATPSLTSRWCSSSLRRCAST